MKILARLLVPMGPAALALILSACGRDFTPPDFPSSSNDTDSILIENPILVDSIAVPDMALLPGESAAARILILPPNASDTTLEISSGNEGVVQVRNGTLHAVAAGIAVLDIRALDGSGKQSRFQVSVAPKPFDLDSRSMHLTVGGAAAAPVLSYFPADAVFNGYILSGGSASIVAISPDGSKVIPVAKGRTHVKAAVRGYPDVYSIFSVTVDPK